MDTGDKVISLQSIRFLIKTDFAIDFDEGITGTIVSSINTHGFCRVQFDFGKIHYTMFVHKDQLKLAE